MRFKDVLPVLAIVVVAVAIVSQPMLWVQVGSEYSIYNTSRIKACYGIIKYPSWGLAEFTLPGGNIVIRFWSLPKIKSISITNGSLTYKLKIVSVRKNEVIAKLPSTVKPSLYDLIVNYSKGSCGMHNAVWVASKTPNKIIFMHVTDNHFGVVNPNGRSAFSYVLAAILLALSMPNVTLIIDTGDLGNTGSVGQYIKAALLYGLLTKPTLSIPGNHDHVSGIKNYEVYVGLTNWSERVGKFLFLGIDSGYYGYINPQQALWAYRVLTHSNATAKIIMFHHPLFSYVYGKTPHYFKVSSWKGLLKVLESKKPGSKYTYIYSSWLQNIKGLEILVKAIYESNASLVLAGHIHLDSYAVIERPNHVKTWFVVTTALGGPVRSKDYHGFRIIEVYSNGTVRVYGEGLPWYRHASYSVEGVKASLSISNAASAEALTITDKKIASMLPHVVLAVPVPTFMQGKFKVYAPGLSKVWKRCTPTYCAVYAESSKVSINKTYTLVVYVKPDKQPPVIKISSAPKYVEPGRPITITYSVSDDAWGVEYTSAVAIINGKVRHVEPMIYGGEYMISFLPSITHGKVVIKISATDYSGKTSTKTVTVYVGKPTTTARTTTTSVTSTTAKVKSTTTTKSVTITTTTTTHTVTKTLRTTTTTTMTTTTFTLPKITITPPTVSLPPTTIKMPPPPSTSPSPVVIGGGIVAVAVAIIIIYLVIRRASK